MTQLLPVADFMTKVPHTIDLEDSLAAARRRMMQLAVHHLPVVREMDLVGVISHHDLVTAQALGVDLERVAVGVAMTAGPYVVEPDAPLPDVARAMAERRVGSAIIMAAGSVQGILTTTDALAQLADLVSGRIPSTGSGPRPSTVRQRVLAEHDVLRDLTKSVETLAENLLHEEDVDVEQELRHRARDLYRMLLHHMMLEDALLVPALSEVPTSGPIRANALRHRHREQREQLLMAMTVAESGDAEHLAEWMLSLVKSVRAEMNDEEQHLLAHDVLHDDVVNIDASDG